MCSTTRLTLNQSMWLYKGGNKVNTFTLMYWYAVMFDYFLDYIAICSQNKSLVLKSDIKSNRIHFFFHVAYLYPNLIKNFNIMA